MATMDQTALAHGRRTGGTQKEKILKTLTLTVLLILQTQALPAQGVSSSIKIANRASTRTGIPAYLVYRHFLAWVSALDRQASASGASDPYKFAEPFATRAGLANADLDLLRNAAQALERAVADHDAEAHAVITEYRSRAQMAAQAGQALPPAPLKVHQLQTERTVLLVQHYQTLRAELGPQTTSRLDAYLSREFAPHLSIQAKAPLPASTVGEQVPAFRATGR